MIPLNRSKNSVYGLLLGAAWLLSGSAAHAQFTNIVDPANPTFTQALGINNANEIVGYGNMTIFNGFTLTLPPVAGNFTRLNVPGADGGTQVIGISNGASPASVGFYIKAGVTHGFANTGGQGGTFTTLDAPGFAFTQLLGINHNGNTAAGYWTTDPAGATGQIAGTVSPMFNGATFTNINHLLPANTNSQATGVNDLGIVSGFYQEGPNTSPVFTAFFDQFGSITSFKVPGSVSTQALGINDQGWIVGDYTVANGDMFGFLDKGGGVFITLDPFGSTAVTANGINDNGNVVGFYVNAAGATIGFESAPLGSTPIPEPSTWAMMLLGFAGLGFLGYRKTLKRTLST
jgi:PEP-CTERM motif